MMIQIEKKTEVEVINAYNRAKKKAINIITKIKTGATFNEYFILLNLPSV